MAVKDGISAEKARLTEKKRTYLCVKRAQDFVLSALALALLSPLLLLIALAVVIDDPQGGPVFSQIRCGKDGKPFRLYKFRDRVLPVSDVFYALPVWTNSPNRSRAGCWTGN